MDEVSDPCPRWDPLLVAVILCTLFVACAVVAVALQLLAMAPAGSATSEAVAQPVREPAGTRLQVAGAVRAEAPSDVSTTFTLADLAAGDVTAARFNAFWDAEVERLRSAPCPPPTAPGATAVTAVVGATPPAHLGDDWTNHAPRMQAELDGLRERCA